MDSKQSPEDGLQMVRLRSAVQFLLENFDPMHHLKMAKIVCFILKDVETYLLEMDDESRIRTFCNIPSITMDDLGFLVSNNSGPSELYAEAVTTEELLLLFVVCYLSLNGKSDIDQLVKHLMRSPTRAISRGELRSHGFVPLRLYLEKGPQYFHVYDDCLELAGAFYWPVNESSSGVTSSKADGILQIAEGTSLLQLDCQTSLASDVLMSSTMAFKNGSGISDMITGEKPSCDSEKDVKIIHSPDSITSKKYVPICEKKKDINSSSKINVNDRCEDQDSFKPKNRNGNFGEIENHEINVKFTLQDTICSAIKEGIMFLYEHFKCPIDMHLVLVVLHVLQDAKSSFQSLKQSEQIALVKSSISPLWVASVEDNSGSYLKPAGEGSKLSKEQMDLILISYAVSQSESHSDKLHRRTLALMFENHRMDDSGLSKENGYFDGDLFSVDEEGCVKFENFPPAKWMAERLFRESYVPSGQDMNVREKIMKRMFTKDLSKLPHNWLDNLVITVQESIDYLLRAFEFNLYSGIFEVIINAAKDCVLFFDQPIEQQKQIVCAIFHLFNVDAHGRVISKYASSFKPLENNWRILLCMLYLVNVKGSVHYRELFKTCHARVGKTKFLTDHKQKSYFESRPENFSISDKGYVSLVTVLTIQFSYISMLLNERNPAPWFINPGSLNQRAVAMNGYFGPPFLNSNPFALSNRPIAVPMKGYFRPPLLNSNAFVPQVIHNPYAFNRNALAPRINFQPQVLIQPKFLIMPQITVCPALNNNPFHGPNTHTHELETIVNNEASTAANTTPIQNSTANTTGIKNSSSNTTPILNSTSSAELAGDEDADSTEEGKVWKTVRAAILYLSQHFTLDAEDFLLIFYVLEDVKSYVMLLPMPARDKFVEKCLNYFFACSSQTDLDSRVLDVEQKVSLFIALLLHREKELHYTQVFEKFFQSSAADLPSLRSESVQFEFVTKWNNIFSVSSNGKVRLLPILIRSSEASAGGDGNEADKEDKNANFHSDIVEVDSRETNFSVDRSNNNQVQNASGFDNIQVQSASGFDNIQVQNASRFDEIHDSKSMNEATRPVFNLLEVLDNDESPVVPSKTDDAISSCHCARDSIKERRTRNFFAVLLVHSKVGLDLQVLKEKLRLASKEVRHYLSCVYKDNIHHFFQCQDDFYFLPTTGNVCYKG